MKSKRHTATAKKVNRKITFHAYQPSIAPTVVDNKLSKELYVPHGKDNLYVERMLSLIDNVGPLGRCRDLGKQFIAGRGPRFFTEGGEEIKEAKTGLHELFGNIEEEEFQRRVCTDLACGMGAFIGVRRSATGDIVRLDHIPRTCMRSGKMKDVTVNGVTERMVTEYYYSPNWERHMMDITDQEFQPKPIPAFDFTGERKDLNSVIFLCDYHPREPYYGIMSWIGAVRAAEVWRLVDDYNYTQLETGFAPAVILSTQIEGTDAEIDEHDRNIEINFVGSRGKGVMHIPRGMGEEPPFVQVLERGNHAGELDAMRENSADVIYSTYGLPAMLMTERKGGLTSQGDAVMARLQQTVETWAKPKQYPLCSLYRKIMEMKGVPSYECKMDQLEVYTPGDSENIIMTTRTVDEVRSGGGLGPHPDPKIGAMMPAQVKGGGTQQRLEEEEEDNEEPPV